MLTVDEKGASAIILPFLEEWAGDLLESISIAACDELRDDSRPTARRQGVSYGGELDQ